MTIQRAQEILNDSTQTEKDTLNFLEEMGYKKETDTVIDYDLVDDMINDTNKE